MNENLEMCVTSLATFEAAVAQLPAYNPVQFNSISMPLEAEIRLSDAWPSFERLSADDWAALRAGVSPTTSARLQAYSLRMGTLAVRGHEVGRIYHAFFGLIIDEKFADPREIWGVASVLNDAGRRVGASVEDIVVAVSRFAAPARQRDLRTWLAWPSSRKDLNGPMGFHAFETEHGIEYRLANTFEMGVQDRLRLAARKGGGAPS